jgi:RNA recognition motif-containing protein
LTRLYASKKKKGGQTLDSCPPGCKVFIGNVPFHTQEQEIEEMVEDLLGEGLISAVNIPRGAKSGRPFGYLFVDFKDPDVAQDFVDVADGLQFEDRVLNSNVKDDKTPPSEASILKKRFVLERSVYLNNLDYTLNEEEVYNMCEDLLGYDLVDRIKIAYDKRTGRPRGFGHIEFKDPATVERALEKLNGLEVLDRVMAVTRLTNPMKATETVEERDKRREEERQQRHNERYRDIKRDDSKFYDGNDGDGDGGDDDRDYKKESMADIFADVMKGVSSSEESVDVDNNCDSTSNKSSSGDDVAQNELVHED